MHHTCNVVVLVQPLGQRLPTTYACASVMYKCRFLGPSGVMCMDRVKTPVEFCSLFHWHLSHDCVDLDAH